MIYGVEMFQRIEFGLWGRYQHEPWANVDSLCMHVRQESLRVWMHEGRWADRVRHSRLFLVSIDLRALARKELCTTKDEDNRYITVKYTVTILIS